MKQYGKSWCETFMEDLHTLGVAVTRVSPNEMYKQPVKEEAMKVQRRCDPKEVYEVMEESATHYIIDRGCNDIALRKKDYEPVEEWVDVTGMYTGLTVQVPGCEHNRYELDLRSDGYRLLERKVKR